MERLTPIKRIRKYCLWCCNFSIYELRLCVSKHCPLYVFRLGKEPRGSSPLKSIRKRCIDCSAGSTRDVRDCPFFECSPHPYRFGHRPESLTPAVSKGFLSKMDILKGA